MNCSLDNMIAKPIKAIKASERAMIAMHDFADLRNELWLPMVVWEGIEIAQHFVSNMGRFCVKGVSCHGEARKLLNITKGRRVRVKGKLLSVEMLVVRAFLVSEPLYGLDQYAIIKKVPSDDDNRAENFVVYLGSYKLQLWKKAAGLPGDVYEIPTPAWSFRKF
jgi:hypothetical protein